MQSNKLGRMAAAGLAAVFGLCLQVRADVILAPPNADITTSSTGWSGTTDSGAVNTFQIVTDPTFGPVLEINYNLSNGNWVNLQSPNFPITENLSALGNALTFRFRGDGEQNLVKVEVKDSTGQDYISTKTVFTNSTNWQTVTLPFDPNFSDFIYNFGGNSLNAFSWNSIAQLGITVQPFNGGAGNLSVDNLAVITIPKAAHTELVFDECELAVLNSLGSDRIGFSSPNNTTVSASEVAPFSGNTCYRITNPTSGALGGMFENIYYNNVTYTSVNLNPYTHLSFYIQSQAPITGIVQAELKDFSSHQVDLNIQNTKYISGGQIPSDGHWAQVLIPLTDFSGPDFTNMKNFSLLVTNMTSAYNLYVDRFSFLTVTYTAQAPNVIDTFDTYYNTSSWKTSQATGAALTLSTVGGEQGNALRLQYNFSATNQYVQAYRGFGLNVLTNNSDAFMFSYKGDAPVSNTLEFKVTDNTNTVFNFKNPNVTNTGNVWKTMTVPYKNFTFFGGNNHTLDFTNLQNIAFAVSKSTSGTGGTGGQGKLDFHQISFGKASDFQQTYSGGQPLQNFNIDNNPFAPGSNSIKAVTHFSFTLNEKSTVTLKVYDVSGNMVYKDELGAVEPGAEMPITWDGKDTNGKVLRNGVYLYMFSAQGKLKTQKIKNVIGIIR